MQEIKMRRITLEDVPALSFIAKKTFYDTFTGTCSEDDMAHFLEQYYNEITLANEVADSAMEYFIAEIEGEIVGYILFSNGKEDFAEIHGSTALELKRFYISKEYHGKGAAQQMMNFFLNHAKAQGYDTVFLGVWEFNYRAQKFYSKFDFKQTSHKHDFPIGNTPQTDVYMWKAID
ncbi:MAG: N-acetyltransferase family protein [Ferruginibacter sp.]